MHEEIKDRKLAEFQRLTGVKPHVFEQMLQAVQNQIRSFGRPCKLCLANQVLLTLMYWREYRTMFHIARDLLPKVIPFRCRDFRLCFVVFASRLLAADCSGWSAVSNRVKN